MFFELSLRNHSQFAAASRKLPLGNSCQPLAKLPQMTRCLQLYLFTRRTEVEFGLDDILPFLHFNDLSVRLDV